ncbi:2-keto-3-deoxy-L-rhamnonate aldolase RhmA [Litoreibacter meonggei]|uniref:2-keto-3-deoxy-L-rhamnonate aldolase RhmA n=1 Tax=Litoreibacter meonggei TaxID=1049199 RepID=A0A497X1F8_9RHOB|nr:aldolase/citrate lyase family protein [Litoreibacter meonggei]RLJ59016.1 2-keto-3-deoxy-L-rhamnonate aldolase RhmA [Litoreibacter meonggei]
MGFSDFKARMASGDRLLGTFVKTPSVEMVEILAKSGLDFICLDAEHAPFDRMRLDACLAVARALDFPTLVRVPAGGEDDILKVMDAGAVGIVVPHVDSAEKARAIAKAARFGRGGRGFAGSTRWAGYATRSMAEVLEQSRTETVVIAQIEEPEGVEDIAGIAGAEGVDGVFIGPADLSVAYGATSVDNDELKEAMTRVGDAARKAGVAYVTWVPNAQTAKAWEGYGFNVFVMASEHAWMLAGARAAVADMQDE